MKTFDLILWTLLVLVGGSVVGVEFVLKESHMEFYYAKEEYIIGLIASNIVFIGGGVAAYFIAKSRKAKSPYKIALITSSILIGLVAINLFI